MNSPRMCLFWVQNFAALNREQCLCSRHSVWMDRVRESLECTFISQNRNLRTICCSLILLINDHWLGWTEQHLLALLARVKFFEVNGNAGQFVFEKGRNVSLSSLSERAKHSLSALYTAKNSLHFCPSSTYSPTSYISRETATNFLVIWVIGRCNLVPLELNTSWHLYS